MAAMDADLDLARQVAVDARQEVVGVAAGLRGSAAIVEKNGDIEPSRFRSFARGVVERSPFLGLSWAPRVYGQERAEFEQELGRPIGSLGADGLEPLPPDESGSYLPLAITYPNSVARREFLGFDTLSDAGAGRGGAGGPESGRATPLAADPARANRRDGCLDLRARVAGRRRVPAHGRSHDLGRSGKDDRGGPSPATRSRLRGHDHRRGEDPHGGATTARRRLGRRERAWTPVGSVGGGHDIRRTWSPRSPSG